MQTKMFQTLIFIATFLTASASFAEEEKGTIYHAPGNLALEVTAGLAAGYGLAGGSVMVAVTDQLGLGVSTGADLLNTHTGLRVNYYMEQSQAAPFLYATLGRSQYKDEHSLYAAGGAGVELRSEIGFYYQASGGFSFYLDGENGEGNAPGFFEFRPLTLGFRF